MDENIVTKTPLALVAEPTSKPAKKPQNSKSTAAKSKELTGAELFVKCLEMEGVEYIFGVPGEENIDMLEALIDSSIDFIPTRHEQGAAFIADVYGRLTGRAGVCLSTLGPGATNLVTGVADANMDRAPLVAIAGQGATTRMHKESHQILNLVKLFEPISKYATQVLEPEIIPEIVRKSFKTAQNEKPGACVIVLPENIAEEPVINHAPLKVNKVTPPTAPIGNCANIATIISQAKAPIIMAGNGIIREGCSEALVDFAEKLNIPIATTFMAKGVIPQSHPLCLGAVGLQAQDFVSYGFGHADLVICIGVDMVEYHPSLWNPNRDKKIIHLDQSPAEVDQHFVIEAGAVGLLSDSMERISIKARRRSDSAIHKLPEIIKAEVSEFKNDSSFPIKPQKIIWDIRQALAPEDIVISDVGAHKMWMARMFQAEVPNTCIISNGFAAMGIALPGAIAAAMAFPDRKAVAVCGDAGFMMNNQEIETALRLNLDIVVIIFNDSKYGLIEWHQLRTFDRSTGIEFGNPDFVQFAQSFGAKGYRVESADELLPTINTALADGTVSIIDVPVDYAENMKLTSKLRSMDSPI